MDALYLAVIFTSLQSINVPFLRPAVELIEFIGFRDLEDEVLLAFDKSLPVGEL